VCQGSSQVGQGASWFQQRIRRNRYLYQERASDARNNNEKVSQRASPHAEKARIDTMDYDELFGRLVNVGENAPLSEKEKALRFVAQALKTNEPDFALKMRASSTLSTLSAPAFDQRERSEFVDGEIAGIMDKLEQKLGAMNVEEGGRRKRRRGKKTRKTKKTRRYTRRR
jgi:hypothetical protein